MSSSPGAATRFRRQDSHTVSTPTERYDRMCEWLMRLADVLLAHGGELAALLVRTTAGKHAVIAIDDVRIGLSAEAGGHGIILRVRHADNSEPLNFETSSEALRDIIGARALLDATIMDGRVQVRAPLNDLLAM